MIDMPDNLLDAKLLIIRLTHALNVITLECREADDAWTDEGCDAKEALRFVSELAGYAQSVLSERA